MLDWSAERIAEYQWNRTLRVLAFAESECPFYAKRFAEHGVRVDEIRDPSDLHRLPVLRKRDLRDNLDDLVPRGTSRAALLETMTGGSTHNPTRFYRDQACLDARGGWTHLLREWFGWRPGDRQAWIWGAAQDMPADPSWHWSLRQRFLHRSLVLPCWKLNDEIFASFVAQMRAQQPRIVCAYPSAAALVAEYMLAHDVTDIRPYSVVLTAETVLPSQRAVIEKAFECRVFSFYGSREGGMMALECSEHRGLHVNAFSLNLEFEREGRAAEPGELGRLLMTDLDNRGTVLVRYEIGDAAAPIADACSCGSQLPRMDFPVGRDTDVFVRPDGTLVPGASIATRVIQESGGIEGVQIVQETLETFVVRAVKGPCFTSEDERKLEAALRRFLGDRVRIDFEYIAEIEPERSGKRRFCISKLGPDWLSGRANS